MGHVKGVRSELKLLKYHCAKGVFKISLRNHVLIKKGFSFNLVNGSLTHLNINGSEQVHLTKLDTKILEVTINGSGRTTAVGKVESLHVSLNGAGQVNASTLDAHKGHIIVNGSGLVKVKLSDRLKARVNGAGRIEYVGKPKTLETDVDGSGAILSVQ
ncbi:GIN domain-containing protein [Celerinatantimonas diazotrophica]|uniref:Putative autotransporter adhesin-like protein n=1 Tax=Celerinatantimonas diazotrophica TaxID=412034 RepID=A0A4R1JLH1_9GAMM|nr:DUF2807 domain-containing protein [Celerinatantimonas diazotrophica]TCK51837.1 putative autotransporter adhesin-like protein [Celerinatantimonas diazotrophica]CAG9296471.1 hypothetical protein CEDIAZO_01622 [Celerinatantimonas diazotrophica]